MASASSYRHEVYHNMSGKNILMGVKDIWQQYGTGEKRHMLPLYEAVS